MSQMKKENSGKGNLFQVQLLLKKRLHCYTWDTDSGKENKFSGQEASVC